MLEYIKTFSALIATLSGIIAGGLAVNGYLKDVDKRLDDRKKQTFELVRMFYSDELVRARKFLLSDERQLCDLASPLYTSGDRVNVYTHVEFFDFAQTCVENRLCDEATTQQFFSPYANWHWPILRKHIEFIRGTEATMKVARPYRHGLQKLAVTPMIAVVDSICRSKAAGAN